MKPVLLWPKPQSAISATLDRSPDDFTVVDTDSRYELRRLSELRSDTPILDPFPGHGKHYREFHSHIAKMSPQSHPGGETTANGGPKTVEACVAEYLKRENGAQYRAIANCPQS